MGRSEPYISAVDYGAVANGNRSTGAGTDNTAALTATVAAAIAAKKPLLIPAGVYKTLDNVSFVGGGGADLADMTIQHFAIPDGSVMVPNGVGVRVKRRLGDRSVLERLHIRNVTSGIYSYEPVDDTTNYVYSTRISDIRVERFRHSAAYLRGYSAGNTGCMFETFTHKTATGTALT